jgi:plasmid stabilization system protein ParE
VSLGLRILPEAERELAEAYRWYEQRRRGLGEEFLLHVEAVLSKIRRNPGMYPEVHGRVQRALVRRFPYGVFYIVEADAAVVLAVMHASRRPGRWRRR